jgi:hypothetical protein
MRQERTRYGEFCNPCILLVLSFIKKYMKVIFAIACTLQFAFLFSQNKEKLIFKNIPKANILGINHRIIIMIHLKLIRKSMKLVSCWINKKLIFTM